MYSIESESFNHSEGSHEQAQEIKRARSQARNEEDDDQPEGDECQLMVEDDVRMAEESDKEDVRVSPIQKRQTRPKARKFSSSSE